VAPRATKGGVVDRCFDRAAQQELGIRPSEDL